MQPEQLARVLLVPELYVCPGLFHVLEPFSLFVSALVGAAAFVDLQ